ncbi:polyprenyl synthetase family protein [Streptomyces sp. NPDC018833]|uniref:polyprenyl synthetase family protein n=1 Tax=Streptomyces sp. NPDC018833 TaxID=3365053 RepID=UPI0037B227D9
MNSLSYQDLHHKFAADIDAETAGALERLGSTSSGTKNAVAGLLRHQQLKHPLSVLPLLVHGAETGSPEPAVPIAAVHVLWWTSACYFDDLSDGNGSTPVGDELGPHEALLASVVAGHVLPLQILRALQTSEEVRGALTTEALTCGAVAAEGQLVDIRGDLSGATRKSVAEVYRGKSGAPFGMITAMAAILAGATPEKIGLWREFGHVFGILWQLFNDQEDILSGRNEDLLNGTVTYLLACALEEGAPGTAERLTDLHAAARESAPARTALTDLLLAPANQHRYHRDLTAFREEAHRLLADLGGDEAYVTALRQLVDHSSRLYL